MALALVLGENETPVAVSAACTLDEVDGAPRITTIELTVRAQVPRLEQTDFEDSVGRAAALCPVSNALRSNVQISLQSELVQH
jgi:osmotically inducible protein OsmC